MARRGRNGLARRMSLAVDDFVGIFSEQARAKRIAYRFQADMAARLAYDGASREHMHENWQGAEGDADSELDADTLDELRARSRERVQNTGLAKSVIGSMVENVVGHGLKPRLNPAADRIGLTHDQVQELRGIHRDHWRLWGKHADARGMMTIADLQALALASCMVNGDVGVMPRAVTDAERAPAPLGLKIDLIEADRIMTPWGIDDVEKGGKRVVNGVVLGARRQPLAYYVAKHHPGDELFGGDRGQFNRIRAHNDDGTPRFMLLQDHARGRVGQTRGEPLFAPVLSAFKNLTDWEEAEIAKAQVAACFAVFITQEAPYEAMMNAANGKTTPAGNRAQEVMPAQIYYGRPGESVQGVSSNSPPTEFEAFYTAVARQICSVTGMPIEVALRNFRGVNYSQARGALLEARKSFTSRQNWMVDHFLDPVHARFMLELWARDLLPPWVTFEMLPYLLLSTTWQTPGWGHIDEQKSMAAAEKALALRVTTRSRIASALHGEDIDDIERDLQREEQQSAGATPHADPEEDEGDDAETDDPDTEDDETDGEEEEQEEDAQE